MAFYLGLQRDANVSSKAYVGFLRSESQNARRHSSNHFYFGIPEKS
jgi:hypothetical protein